MARQNLAILHAAESDLVAKINNWFDQTMDRTSQRFTASTRMITFVGAFIVAFALQVDTPAIVNRLSADDQLRQQLVKDAETLYAERSARQASKPAGPRERGSGTDRLTKAETDMAQKHRAMLSAAGLVRLPSSGEAWLNGFGPDERSGDAAHGAVPEPRRAVLVQRARQAPPAAVGPRCQGRQATRRTADELNRQQHRPARPPASHRRPRRRTSWRASAAI